MAVTLGRDAGTLSSPRLWLMLRVIATRADPRPKRARDVIVVEMQLSRSAKCRAADSNHPPGAAGNLFQAAAEHGAHSCVALARSVERIGVDTIAVCVVEVARTLTPIVLCKLVGVLNAPRSRALYRLHVRIDARPRSVFQAVRLFRFDRFFLAKIVSVQIRNERD